MSKVVYHPTVLGTDFIEAGLQLQEQAVQHFQVQGCSGPEWECYCHERQRNGLCKSECGACPHTM